MGGKRARSQLSLQTEEYTEEKGVVVVPDEKNENFEVDF